MVCGQGKLRNEGNSQAVGYECLHDDVVVCDHHDPRLEACCGCSTAQAALKVGTGNDPRLVGEFGNADQPLVGGGVVDRQDQRELVEQYRLDVQRPGAGRG